MKGKKTGGRQPGTQNKVTTKARECIASMLGSYIDSELMQKDLLGLEGKDRLLIAEKLMKYILPAMQSTAVDLNVTEGGQTLEDRLIHLGNKGADNTDEHV